MVLPRASAANPPAAVHFYLPRALSVPRRKVLLTNEATSAPLLFFLHRRLVDSIDRPRSVGPTSPGSSRSHETMATRTNERALVNANDDASERERNFPPKISPPIDHRIGSNDHLVRRCFHALLLPPLFAVVSASANFVRSNRRTAVASLRAARAFRNRRCKFVQARKQCAQAYPPRNNYGSVVSTLSNTKSN